MIAGSVGCFSVTGSAVLCVAALGKPFKVSAPCNEVLVDFELSVSRFEKDQLTLIGYSYL